MSKKASIKDSLKSLEKITSWFEEGDDLDVEEGLKKVKEGAVIIKELKVRLKDVENEFEEIKRELDDGE
ncbi:MAG: exodeoxyribonuclease VII small subunit [bacterium]|nr:exodeoxyribonuclease VII small subunit [bacterium]